MAFGASNKLALVMLAVLVFGLVNSTLHIDQSHEVIDEVPTCKVAIKRVSYYPNKLLLIFCKKNILNLEKNLLIFDESTDLKALPNPLRTNNRIVVKIFDLINIQSF
jgi:hypothetical protein